MTFAALAMALAILPQTSDPASPEMWESTRTDTVALATLSLQDGISLAVRCRDGTFDFIIAGLPVVDRINRALVVPFGGFDDYTTRWSQSPDRTQAFSPLPAPMARDLVNGGRFQITLMENDVNGAHFEYQLPPSNGKIEEVLLACGRPVVDTRFRFKMVASEPGQVMIRRVPQSRFPAEARRAGRTFGAVTTTCVGRPNRRIDDCVVESESPPGFGFGQSVLQAMPQARLGDINFPVSGEPVMVVINTTFDGRPRQGSARR